MFSVYFTLHVFMGLGPNKRSKGANLLISYLDIATQTPKSVPLTT